MQKLFILVAVAALVFGSARAGERAPGDPKGEIAALRADIAKLRLELEAAMKEIKSLKDALRQAGKLPEDGPTYLGKSVRFWLEQVKDADTTFRAEAVHALGILAQRNKDLIPRLMPVLVTSLKEDEKETVGNAAAKAVGSLGKGVLPVLVEILKDKSSPVVRSRAMMALRGLGADAKAAVPLLTRILKEKDSSLFGAASTTLGIIGADAKPAIPAMIDALGLTLQELQMKAKQGKPDKFKFFYPNPKLDEKQNLALVLVRDMVKINPEVSAILPSHLPGTFRSANGSAIQTEWSVYSPEQMAQWEKAYNALKSKYK